MPTAAPYKPWILGAVVTGSLVVCGVLLRRGGPASEPPATPMPAPKAEAWLVTKRDLQASQAQKDIEARFEAGRDEETKNLALAAAAKLGERASVVWLAHVGASDPRFAAQANRALGQFTNRSVGPELGEIATSDGPAAVRAAAVTALVATGDLAQAVQVGALVADGSQPLIVRQAAANALGQMRRPGSAPALAAALEGLGTSAARGDQQLRVSIILALGRIGTTEARAALDAHARQNLPDAERTVLENARRLPQ
ncbi:MAG TPA: HEAT repeat domain-containing protein [Polyangia bacterium]|jgi:HEAT repeat protein